MMEDDGECDYVIVPDRKSSVEEANSSQDVGQTSYLQQLSDAVDGLGEPFWLLNRHIHETPELAFKEYKAHDALTSYLKTHPGWRVTRSAYGIETAWEAIYDSGKAGRVVSFNAEMGERIILAISALAMLLTTSSPDALPGMGHACGHNLIAMASVAAGLATAQVIKDNNLAGKVIIFGTPGEESYKGGKILLLERGAYKGVDISLISHPGILHNSALVRTTAFARIEAEFIGKAAHAAKDPWKGINALDALVISYTAISALRQQTKPGDVIGLAITDGGGSATNMIHAHAACVSVIRAESTARLKILLEKVGACFRAGAEATGAQVKIKITEGYRDHVPNCVLAASYTRYWNILPNVPDPPIPPAQCENRQFTHIMSSTDQGNLSYVMPSLNASFAIPPGPNGGRPHSPDFELASGTKGAFLRALRVGKSLAGVAVDIITQPELLDRARRQWHRDMDDATMNQDN